MVQPFEYLMTILCSNCGHVEFVAENKELFK